MHFLSPHTHTYTQAYIRMRDRDTFIDELKLNRVRIKIYQYALDEWHTVRAGKKSIEKNELFSAHLKSFTSHQPMKSTEKCFDERKKKKKEAKKKCEMKENEIYLLCIMWHVESDSILG